MGGIKGISAARTCSLYEGGGELLVEDEEDMVTEAQLMVIVGIDSS
jgi:hypothetical protein